MDQYGYDPMMPNGEQDGALFSNEQKPKRPLGRDKLQIGMPLIAVAFIFVCSIIAYNVLAVLAYLLFPTAPFVEQMWFSMLLSSVSMYGIAMPLSLLFYRAVPATKIERRGMSLHVLLGVIGICFLLTYAGSHMGNLLNTIIGSITGEMPENDLAETTSQMSVWFNILFTAILAPIFEEIFYRKLLLDRIAQYGELPAILISGIGFGLIHGNFYQFFYAAMVGILLGYVYLKTGKLRYSIAIHMILNFIGGVFTSEMLKQMDPYYETNGSMFGMLQSINGFLMMASYFFFMGAVIIGGIVAIALLWKRISFRRAEQPLTGKEWAKVLLLNPATWIYLGVIVFMFVISLA